VNSHDAPRAEVEKFEASRSAKILPVTACSNAIHFWA
jgi:hypothetical protein